MKLETYEQIMKDMYKWIEANGGSSKPLAKMWEIESLTQECSVSLSNIN